MNVHVNICVCMCIHICVCGLYMYTHICIYVLCIYICVCMCTCTIYTYNYMQELMIRHIGHILYVNASNVELPEPAVRRMVVLSRGVFWARTKTHMIHPDTERNLQRPGRRWASDVDPKMCIPTG